MVYEPLAHIALHHRAEDVLADAAATVRRLAGSATAFAAVASPSGGYRMVVRDGLYEPGWRNVEIRHGRGLGGRVLTERRPLLSHDYLVDESITGDYRDIVGAEGLRGVGCVPVLGPDRPAALLYVGERIVGQPGSRLIEQLERVADMASAGLTVVARAAADHDTQRPSELATTVHLTPREREVLALLAAGASNREIAQRLVLAESTVKGYVSALLEKFDAKSRLQLVATARRWAVL
jgi:LuxR family transcriptional regulator, regulator of acetate metabolism